VASISLPAIAAIGAGSLLVWSGVKGWSIVATLGDLVTGVKPKEQTPSALVDPTYKSPSGPDSPVPNGGGDLAGVALGYQGHAYNFGGAPGPDGSQPWDCSSFCNFCVAIKMGWAIPGYKPGQYNGKTHGPATGQWAIWSGLQRVSRGDVARGDIILWGGHMGIAVDNSTMISALNAREGTRVTKIEGTGRGPIIFTGRIK
jgi:cell wall-associated NlpC family hydrolase